MRILLDVIRWRGHSFSKIVADPIFTDPIFTRHTKTNQMHKTKALVAISRKLLRVLFALVRDGVEYNQNKTGLLAA